MKARVISVQVGLTAMASQYDYYQRQAEECMEMSRKSPAMRAPWLELADKWLHMIPADCRQLEGFRGNLQGKVTRQANSNATH